jgi:hypothetical protein
MFNEVTKCVFYHHNKTIKHIFFQCQLARSIWPIIQICSTLYPLCSVANIFGNWLNGVDRRVKILIRVGAFVIILSLWLCRNDHILMIKITLACRLSTSPLLAQFMVVSSACEESRSIYGGFYAIIGHIDGIFS